MKIASITETKNNLSLYLDLVRNGETVIIMDRQSPIARLEPVHNDKVNDEGRLCRLERAGLVQRSVGKKVSRELSAPPKLPGIDILKLLLAEREEGR